MRFLIILGVLIMLGGGALLIFDEYETEKEHGATVLGADISLTTKQMEQIPPWVGGGLMGLGAVLAITGALRIKTR